MQFYEYIKQVQPLLKESEKIKNDIFSIEAKLRSVNKTLYNLNIECCGERIELVDGYYVEPMLWGLDGDCYLTLFHSSEPNKTINCISVYRYPGNHNNYDYSDREYAQQIVYTKNQLNVGESVKEKLFGLVLKILRWMNFLPHLNDVYVTLPDCYVQDFPKTI